MFSEKHTASDTFYKDQLLNWPKHRQTNTTKIFTKLRCFLLMFTFLYTYAVFRYATLYKTTDSHNKIKRPTKVA